MGGWAGRSARSSLDGRNGLPAEAMPIVPVMQPRHATDVLGVSPHCRDVLCTSVTFCCQAPAHWRCVIFLHSRINRNGHPEAHLGVLRQ